jgi:hypothetical protein
VWLTGIALDSNSTVPRKRKTVPKWVATRADTKWHFQFFLKYDYRSLLDVIIAIIATFFRQSDNRYFVIIAEYFA